MRALRVCLLIVGLGLGAWGKNTKLKEVMRWKQLDFAYPSEEARKEAIASNQFIPANNLPLGLEVWNEKLFITVPRWKSGVPSSLNYVNIKTGDDSPAMIPYPSWEFNNITNAKKNDTRVVNTFRIKADACDRLWVMDCGLNNILGGAEAISPTKLLVFDLKTDKLLREYHLKPTDVKDSSFFANIVVDVTSDKCDEAYAYLPDLGSFSLVVYSWKDNDSWRVTHHYFYFDPLSGNYNVGGVNFQWTDGIFGVALSPIQKDGYRTMYFHPLSSTREFAVSTKVIQNKTASSESYHNYRVLGSRGPNTQATASYLDEKSGVVFYTQINKDAVGCWNSYKYASEYSADTNGVVASDNETMIFPNDLKVDRKQNLWVLTDKLPLFVYRKLDVNDINFRILMAPVSDAINGTICQ